MCGISGALGINNGARVVRIINRNMIHRGPDSEGYYDAPPFHLGARRLKIIDLVSGDQPIFNEDHTVAVVFNGEIYNFQQLYAELQGYGHHFVTRSDTEVLVHAYEEWGEKSPEHLRGMFAIAILDSRPKAGDPGDGSPRLFLVRDRFGVKPLYYWLDGEKFLFASELRALLSSGYIPRRLSLEGIYTYLAFGSVQEPLTIVSGIYSLPPAGYMQIEYHNSEIKINQGRYWSPKKAASRHPSDEEIRFWLSDAIGSHLTSDVPLGSFLSGGIDSGCIVALSSQKLAKPLKTFTLAFDNWPMDERNLAKLTARRWQTEHSERLITAADILHDLPDALAAMDQPTIDGINSWYISREAKRSGLTVALSGVGGDEIFAGYPSFSITPRLKLLPHPLPWLKLLPDWDGAWSILPGSPDAHRKFAAYMAGAGPLSHPYFAVRGLFAQPQIDRLLKTATANHIQTHNILPIWLKAISDEVHTASQYDSVGEVSWLELSQYTRSTLLRDTDMMSMAHSLEVRVPFLDHILAENILSLPGTFKYAPKTPKKILRNMLQNDLPGEILNAPKRTFTFPFQVWLSNEMEEYFGAQIQDLHPSLRELINQSEVHKIWEQYHTGKTNWSRPWSLFVLNSWVKENSF